MTSPAPSPAPLKPHPLKPEPLFHSVPSFFGVPINHNYNHNHEHLLQVGLIVMACMVGMVMFLCTMSIILRHYYSRRQNNNSGSRRRNPPILFDVNGGDSGVVSDDNDDGALTVNPIWFIRTEGLQQSVIDSITVFKYRKEGVIDGTECSVCLAEFEQEQSLRLLPKCSHAFHIPCIDTWLRSHKNCPLCRAPVLHDAAVTVSGSATEPDSNVSGQNQENNNIENMDSTSIGEETYHVGASESSVLRVGHEYDDSEGGDSEIPDKILPNTDKVNCHASIGSWEVEIEGEIQPIRRSVSMDSSSASIVFRDLEGLDTHLDDENNSSSKDTVIAKQGSGSSTTIHKPASMARAVHKRPISLRGSFAHNTKFLFSTHSRSQSSTLPL